MDGSNLEKLPFWKNLTEDEKRLIERNTSIQHFSKGKLILNSDEACKGLIFVLSGELRISMISQEGREITLYRLYPEELCVLSASCILQPITFETITTATKDCTEWLIHSSAFEQLMRQNLYLRCFMYELLCNRFSSVVWTMQMILFQGYDRRLAAFLITEYERTGQKTLQMTHEQIAQYTNSAREVVARMLKRFAGEGYVAFKRGTITLIDIDGLKKLL